MKLARHGQLTGEKYRSVFSQRVSFASDTTVSAQATVFHNFLPKGGCFIDLNIPRAGKLEIVAFNQAVDRRIPEKLIGIFGIPFI